MRLWNNIFILISILGCMASVMSCSDEGEDNIVFHKGQTGPLNGRYGVRWQVSNPYDMGERCLNAKGLKASFGIGSSRGSSDFDKIYPWSEIRRCNLRREGDSTIVVYEGERGFTTNGTNGDVMVRIPKCYVEKYTIDGYEYRVVSGQGERPHPAFIEDGRELDAIYVGAFEGHIGSDSMLYSWSNVIPTSNLRAQQFLDAAQRRGPQYSLYDMRTVDLIFSLFAVEYGCRNSSKIFGHGIADYKQAMEQQWVGNRDLYSVDSINHVNQIRCKGPYCWHLRKGTNICICKGNQQDILTFARLTEVSISGTYTTYTFDGPPINITKQCFIGSCAQNTNWTETCSAPVRGHSGRANIIEPYFDPRERNPMRYRWMENLVGNLWHFLPDISNKAGQLYQCQDMRRYKFGQFSTPYMPIGETLQTGMANGTLKDVPGPNYWVTSLMDDSLGLGISFGRAFSKDLTSHDAFGAYYYVGTDSHIVANGGGFDHRNRCNLLTTRAWIYETQRWFLYGARLIYKDI